MSDALTQLEKRVAKLEEELREVKAQISKEPERPWWEKLVGSRKGDKTFEAVAREGRKIREAERRAARAEGKKAGKAKASRKAGASDRKG